MKCQGMLMIAALAGAATGCLSAEEEEKNQPVDVQALLLGSATGSTVNVSLYAAEALHVGLNDVYYRVTRSSDDSVVTSAALTQRPMMAMMSMEHGTPNEQPPAVADAQGLFPAKIVFIMATAASGSDAGTWRIELSVDLQNGSAAEELIFADVPVAASSARKDLLVANGMGGTVPVVITLNFAKDASVGHNAFTLTAHKKTQMGMVWEPMTDWAITVTPTMPTMGHGSPGNVNPTHVAAGRYDGSVNFTMWGLWSVVFAFEDALGASLGDVEYELDL